jgi:lysophospholipase L1-like esterase
MTRFLVPFVLFIALCAVVRADDVVWPPSHPPAGTSTAEFPAPRIDQAENFLNHVRQARAQAVDLIFDGDSITDFWQAGGNRGQALLQKLYVPLHVVDFAIAGDRTQHVLWRLAHGELDTLHPKLVMLMIGTNNLGNNSSQEIADGITKIVQTYRTQCPEMHVLLLAIFPRGHMANDPARAKIKEINAIISKLDDGAHVTYLDIGDKFLQPDGTLAPEIMPDFLHPTAKGYQIWADAVQPMIDKYCPASAAAASVAPSPVPTPGQIDATLPTMPWPFPMNAPSGTSSAVFPVPHSDWFYRFQSNLDKLKQGPYDLVFDGDSITDNWQGPGRAVLESRYGKIKTLDVAIGGDQVQHVLWRLQHGDLEGQNPKLIMLMIGTNNGGQNPKDIAAGIKLIIGEYEKRCADAHILLLGVFPRGHEANTPTRQWVKAINAIISAYASDPRVTYLDIGDKFLQPDGTLTAEIMPDFLHPSNAGYVIWADAIQPVIDKYFPGASAK